MKKTWWRIYPEIPTNGNRDHWLPQQVVNTECQRGEEAQSVFPHEVSPFPHHYIVDDLFCLAASHAAGYFSQRSLFPTNLIFFARLWFLPFILFIGPVCAPEYCFPFPWHFWESVPPHSREWFHWRLTPCHVVFSNLSNLIFLPLGVVFAQNRSFPISVLTYDYLRDLLNLDLYSIEKESRRISRLV
jgi:hypothetical protein